MYILVHISFSFGRRLVLFRAYMQYKKIMHITKVSHSEQCSEIQLGRIILKRAFDFDFSQRCIYLQLSKSKNLKDKGLSKTGIREIT